jgi:hypothetical protein
MQTPRLQQVRSSPGALCGASYYFQGNVTKVPLLVKAAIDALLTGLLPHIQLLRPTASLVQRSRRPRLAHAMPCHPRPIDEMELDRSMECTYFN